MEAFLKKQAIGEMGLMIDVMFVLEKEEEMKKIKLTGLFLALVMVLTACGGSNNKQGEDQEGGQAAAGDSSTLKVAVAADAITLDPENYNDVYSESIMAQIYSKLMDFDSEGKLVEDLAESIEQPDAQSFIVHLKDGVKFHNGDPLKASDVVFSLKRARKSTKYAYIYEKIDENSFETPDEKTVKFKLTEPDGSFLAALAHPAVAILNEKAVTEGGDNYGKNPVGTGPYKFDSWTKLQSISLTRFDDYFGDKAKSEKVEFRIIPEANNRLIELESGGVDIAYEIAPNDVKKIEENKDLELLRKMDQSVHFLGLTVDENGIFANPKAREAMTHALNMDEIVKTVYQGVGKVATGPVNPQIIYSASDQMKPAKYDPELAKKLFAEAGLKEGSHLKLYVNDNQQRQDIAQIVQAQLQELGIQVDITTLEWGAYMEALKNNQHDMFIMSWNPSIADPHYAMYSPFHSKNMGEGPNFMFYQNPEVDKVLDQAIQLMNGKEREDLYKKAQELVDKDHPWIYIANGEQVVGTRKNVKGLKLRASTTQKLDPVSKD